REPPPQGEDLRNRFLILQVDREVSRLGSHRDHESRSVWIDVSGGEARILGLPTKGEQVHSVTAPGLAGPQPEGFDGATPAVIEGSGWVIALAIERCERRHGPGYGMAVVSHAAPDLIPRGTLTLRDGQEQDRADAGEP